MKITTFVKYDKNMNVICEESFDYKGDVALCGGGGKSASTPDVSAPAAVVQKTQTKPVSEASTAARNAQNEKAQKAKGLKSTILTAENQNDTASNSSNSKTLLGQ